MDFSEILSLFDIREILYVDNYILGQIGYVFHLATAIAYLYEETKGDSFGELYINSSRIELSNIELAKIHSIIRLEGIAPRKLQQKDFYIYSNTIELSMQRLLDRRPDLVKGSSHMAFLPKNYTRFSENLVFDFNYLYNDDLIAKTMMEFDDIFESKIKPKLPEGYPTNGIWTDGQLYRFLLDYIKTKRVSTNGKLPLPLFLRKLFSLNLRYSGENLALYFGPYLLYLKVNCTLANIMPRKQNIDLEELSDTVEIIYPDYKLIMELFEEELFQFEL